MLHPTICNPPRVKGQKNSSVFIEHHTLNGFLMSSACNILGPLGSVPPANLSLQANTAHGMNRGIAKKVPTLEILP